MTTLWIAAIFFWCGYALHSALTQWREDSARREYQDAIDQRSRKEVTS